MADGHVQIGAIGVTWGIDAETYGYVESLTTTDESNGREDVIDGDGDIVDQGDHAGDQHVTGRDRTAAPN